MWRSADPMKNPTFPLRPSRRAFHVPGLALVAAAALGPVLLGHALYGWWSVRDAGAAVLRGEAGGWGRTVQARLREMEGGATHEALAALLDELRDDGLTYLALVGRGGVRMEAGTPSPSPRSAAATDEPLLVDGRVRVVLPGPRGADRGPRRRPVFLRDQPMPPAWHGDGPRPAEGRPPQGPQALIIEFEPRHWPQLMGAARRSLIFGSATAFTVMLLSLVAWQASRRQRLMEQEAARARHLAVLGEMSAVLAHEIRNPLAALKGHAQLLEEALVDPALEKARAKVGRIVTEATRLERITTDLLGFVRTGELARARTDLTALVRDSLEDVVPADRLRLDLPVNPVIVDVDAARLRQAIDNVARNAVQGGEGAVEIALSLEGEVVTIAVRDHGAGIPAGQEEHIFEPFVTTRTRGTGLGLSIARRIVDLHGGTLTAANHPDGGAVFRIRLPRARGT